MRVLLIAALAAGVFLAAACGADRPSSARIPTSPALTPASSQFPGSCFGIDDPLDVGEGNDVDANGNGWVCVADSDGHHYDDNHLICFAGTAVTAVGDPADANGNGFVCLLSDGSKVDDVPDIGGTGPPGGIGGDIVCPDGYTATLVLALPGFGDPTDVNGNDWICVNGVGDKVDDILEDEPVLLALTAGKVNGHGVYEVDDGTLSFSFHASSDGEVVNGNFEFHDRDGGVRFHGDVTCLEVDGMTAMLEGVVTLSKEAAPPVGTTITWIAVDNGEGKKAPADLVSDPEIGGPAGDPCGPAPVEAPVAIRGGNVQVKE